MIRETHYDEKGNPRTKGIRNPFVAEANARKGGPMTNRNEKRQGSRSQQDKRAIREHAE